jgi:hypothetical protein
LLKFLAPSITAKLDNKKLDEVPPPVRETPAEATTQTSSIPRTERQSVANSTLPNNL